MRRFMKFGIVAAVVVAGLAGAAGLAVADDGEGAAAGGERDREAIEAIRDGQYRAWADKDGAAFAADFAKDGDLVTFNGEHLRTRDGIAAGMQYYFDNFIEDTTIELLDEKVRFADSRTAVVVRTTCLVRDGESQCRDGSDSVNTNVYTKSRGEWSQQSFQNTRVDPIE